MTVQETISDLMKLKQLNSKHLNRIYNFEKLIESLEELDNLIEMVSAKDTICEQIKFLIVEKDSNDKSMLNAVITGLPGVGKTKLASILAKIWTSMGLIKKKENTDLSKTIPILVSNHLYETHITDLKNKVVDLQSGMLEIKTKLSQSDSDVDKLDNQLERLRRKNKFINYKHEAHTFNTIVKIRNNNSDLTDVIDKHIPNIPQIDLTAARDSSDINTDFEYLKIVTREDFVAGYVGQTATKTKNLLEKSRGKVLFIDEAYALYNGGEGTNDPFGMEALTTLNEFLSRYPDEIIVIFAGYKYLMDNTIFKQQPGLKRRCMWTFNIESYSPAGLSNIFEYQIKNDNWSLQKENSLSNNPLTPSLSNVPDNLNSTLFTTSSIDPIVPYNTFENVNLVNFFEKNIGDFPNFGGDTEKLAYHCKLAYTKLKYDLLINDKPVSFDHIINNTMLTLAYSKYKDHQKTEFKECGNWKDMYG